MRYLTYSDSCRLDEISYHKSISHSCRLDEIFIPNPISRIAEFVNIFARIQYDQHLISYRLMKYSSQMNITDDCLTIFIFKNTFHMKSIKSSGYSHKDKVRLLFSPELDTNHYQCPQSSFTMMCSRYQKCV